ncbi:MAG: GvpL/GvpF family gas vesicle protein [Solirubrobacterales bacterium]
MSGGLLYVYAIADSSPGEGVTGLHGAPLRVVEHGDLRAVVSDHAVAPEPDEEVLWAHERVLEELMRDSTILPMRFGSTVTADEVLKAALAQREEEFVASLGRVRGAVELSVRAQLPRVAEPNELDPPPPAKPSGPGTAYLLDRARQQRRGEEVAELVHRPLSGLARRSLSKVGRGDPCSFKAAYLVDEGVVETFGERVGTLNETFQDLSVSCTGPWPPYSFVSEEPG